LSLLVLRKKSSSIFFRWSVSVHPKVQHFGLITANLEAMIDWYRKVLGMTVNHRSAAPAGAQKGRPSLSAAWASNDEVNHRIAFVELPGLTVDSDKSRHARLQHVAFEYQTIDDLLGTYARLKRLGIEPALAADQGLQTAFYYADPDQNSVELNVNNYGNEWTATEHVKTSASFAARPMGAYVDPDKMIAARKASASPSSCMSAPSPGNLLRRDRTIPACSSEPRCTRTITGAIEIAHIRRTANSAARNNVFTVHAYCDNVLASF
jgi:catechol 2,3-dioxygenase-like lactoylglutathione lyase family enzyme